MRNSVKISVLHVVLLSMTVIGLKNHVTILPAILEVAKRDGWMSVILGFVGVIPFLWCMYTYNKTAKIKKYTPIHYIIACLILTLCAMTMVEMLMWVKTTFLPETPLLVMFSCYFIACLLFAMLGIQAIVTVNVIVLAGVLILGFFVAFVNIQVKDYSLLLPMLEHGVVPVMKASVFPASGYIELVLLLFLLPYLKERLKFTHFLLMAVFLAGLTLGPLVGAIVEFGPEEASKQRYPAFEEWGLAAIGSFIDHMDFFSVYQWMTGAFIRVSFYLFITIEIFGLTQQPKKVWMYIAPPFAILCFVLMILDENIFVYINNYVLPILTFGVLVLFCLFVWLTSIKKRKKERKKERKYDEQPIVR